MQHASTTPCVGRESELASLNELYRDARQQGERLVFLEGPSGMGKSRILKEFRGRLRLEGGAILEGRCEPGRAFGPFADVVEGALRFLSEVGREASIDLADLSCRAGCHRFWYQHHGAGAEEPRPLNPVTGAEVIALERRLRFFDAIRTLLVDVAQACPPVVLLHDLERADRGTLQLLAHLLESTGPWESQVGPGMALPALLLGSLRSDVETPHQDVVDTLRKHPRTTSLTVGQLDVEGVRAYLQSGETVERVLARTGGVPEAIDLLLEGDPLTPVSRVERRLASLSAPARALTEALAIVEHPSDAEVLARVAGETIDASHRNEFGHNELVRHDVVDGALLFCFQRESDRERAYALLSEPRRRALHARCVEVYRHKPGHEQDAAHHALCAGDFVQAVPLAVVAARALAARHAHGEAAALLEKVVGAIPGPAPVEARTDLSELYRAAGDYKRALAHARAVQTAEPQNPEAARRVGELLTLAGHLEEAAEALGDARRLSAASGDPSAVAQADALLAELCYQRASYDQARTHGDSALSAALALGELPLALHARNTLGKVALAQREASTAAEIFEQNLNQATAAELRHQQAQALTNLGAAMLRLQELGAAEEAFTKAIDVASKASDTRDRAIATENLAVLAHLRRDYGRAQAYYHDAVALLKRLGNRAMLARVAINLGELYLSLGERSRARTLCDFASHMGGAGLPPSVAGEALVLRGRIDAACGESANARVAFEAALKTYRRLGESRVADAMLELAKVALADGDVAAAREVLAKLPVAESKKRTAEVALVVIEVERAAGNDTLSAARRAVELGERAEDSELLLPALTFYARSLCEAGQTFDAYEALERAMHIDAELTERVPEESLEAWHGRAVRASLDDVQARLAVMAASDEGRERPHRRPSSVPPPRVGQGSHQHRARWSKRYAELVGDSPAMSTVKAMLDKVAPTDALVLIRGESGTGKELIADALHRNSPRRDKPMVKVNCAALVETLLLSELFGHERGAFTGASARKKGRFELANQGTIFLDEIGDISLKTQMALLRVLQEREFERVGGTHPIKVDVRIIAATHRDLEAMVREGTFREDLYYRLRGVMIESPPLRQRLDDLPNLSARLLDRIARERGEASKVMSREALALLASHRWSGNVRELENVLRSATLFAETSVLVPEDFSPFAESFRSGDPEPETSQADAGGTDVGFEDLLYQRIRGGDESLFEMKKSIERECISRALTETEGNITQAAALLGMKRPRLSQLVKQYGLSSSRGEA